jgi:hypothetical protein
VPRIPRQQGLIKDRLGQLAGLAGWPDSVVALRRPAGPGDARSQLAALVTAGTLRYLTHGHGSPVLLVHVATAPNAVLHALPALPEALWPPSLAAVWSASAAITAAYAPAQPAPPGALPSAPAGSGAAADAVDRAVRHRDEHVIKFTDTAVEVCQRTDDPRALAAAARAARLISPSRPARP